jgi:uncharacterized delta-60 repeat protein
MRLWGGYDSDPPVLRSRGDCPHGRRVLTVSVRDESPLARLTVSSGGHVLRATTHTRLRLRIANSRPLAIQAVDMSGNASRQRVPTPACAGRLSRAAAAVAAHPGALDPFFAERGRLAIDPPGEHLSPIAIDRQRDGKIVVVGTFGPALLSELAVMRFEPNGERDPSFGSGGIARPLSDQVFEAEGIASQADGGVVLAGGTSSSQNGYESAIVRLTPDGRLDTAFGSGGFATTRFTGDYDRFTSVVVQPDGRIVAAGGHTDYNSGTYATLVRFSADGRLDESFMQAGRGMPGDFSFPHLAIDPKGDTIAIGGQLDCRRAGSTCEAPRLVMGLRFGQGPVPTTLASPLFTPETGLYASVRGVTPLPDGRIQVIGSLHDRYFRNPRLLAIVLDRQLGLRDWRVIADRTIEDGAVAGADPDGRTVLVDTAGDPRHPRVILARLARSGLALDRTFGRDGRTEVGLDQPFADALVQPDGTILVLTGRGPSARPGQVSPSPTTISRYLGGDDRQGPRIVIRPVRAACKHGRRGVKISVRDDSTPPVTVSVRRGGRTLVHTAKASIVVRAWARARSPLRRTLRVEARDTAGNQATAQHTLRRCPHGP